MSSSDDDDVNVMGTALVRQGPVSETMRMKVGARHELKVAPRDVMPEMPSVRPAPMKTRTLKSQTQAKHKYVLSSAACAPNSRPQVLPLGYSAMLRPCHVYSLEIAIIA